MTKPMTPKQEAFCMAYIETGNATRAYRLAYDAENMQNSTISNEAYKLMKDHDITMRIKELQEQYAELNKVTVETLTHELSEAQEIARQEGQAGAFVSATTAKAKLHGLLIKRVETKEVETRTPEQIDAEILALIKSFGK